MGAIERMGQRRRVMTLRPICNAQGVKLVESGVHVDRKLYERLSEHTLGAPLESLLSVEGAVSLASIVQLAHEQCERNPLAQRLVAALGLQLGVQRLLAPLRQVALPQSAAFALTVLREQQPALFTHSVLVALTAVFLGLREGVDERECTKLAAAGLLHDIGTLYMDPQWQDTSRKITGEGRRQLVVHPVTSAMMVRAQGVYPESVVRAVLEHHERMDGAGYPRGLHRGEISWMGQILLLAEVVAAFFEKFGAEAPQRLLLTLRLQPGKFPQEPVEQVRRLLAAAQPSAVDASHAQEVRESVARLSAAFSQWGLCASELPAQCLQADTAMPSAYVHARLQRLQTALFDAGSHPEQLALALGFLLDDEKGLLELVYLGREALWQLQAIIDATMGRWPLLEQSDAPGDLAVVRWREGCDKRAATKP